MSDSLAKNLILDMMEKKFDLMNVFTEDHVYTKNGVECVNQAKTPCKGGKYAFKGWEKASRKELLAAINYDADGFGLRLGLQDNGLHIMSLDFDICGEKDEITGERKGCKETAALWREFRANVNRDDGIFSSSTAGNWNVLIDITQCSDIVFKVNKMNTSKFKHFGLEVLMKQNQVIPPTATTCKVTGKLGKPRKFLNDVPFYIMTPDDVFVHDFLLNLLTTQEEKNKPTKKPVLQVRAALPSSVHDSNEDRIPEAEILDLLLTVFGPQKITSFDDWFAICGILKGNGYQKSLWIEYNNQLSESNSKRNASKKWDQPGTGNPHIPVKTLYSLAVSLRPDAFKAFCKRHASSSGMQQFKLEDWYTKSDEVHEDFSFQAVCKKFEETHTKISNVSMFVETHPDGDVIYTKTGLITTFEHMTYIDVITKKDGSQFNKTKNFISDWLRNNPDQKIKRKMESFPHDLTCPDDVYNLWRPFAYQREVENYAYDEEVVESVKNHIKILTGHHDYASEYTLDWIASCIQHPSKKLPMPVLVSSEGAGKGTLVRLLETLLGTTKVLETQEPSKEVWGEFNSLMTNAYIVVLDEISKKEMTGCEGRVKGLITEPTMRINDKGKSRFEITSYHKFIALSNPDAFGNEPMTTTADDRRKYFMKCSDELIGNTKYFDDFYAMLKDDVKMKSVFEFFNNRKITLLNGKLPRTEYNEELKALGTPVLKLFVKDAVDLFVGDEVTSVDLFEMFVRWVDKNKVKYECNSLQFACRFANLKLKGMTKTNIGESRLKGWKVDIALVKEELGVGCLIPTKN